jgi:hypothetical protein
MEKSNDSWNLDGDWQSPLSAAAAEWKPPAMGAPVKSASSNTATTTSTSSSSSLAESTSVSDLKAAGVKEFVPGHGWAASAQASTPTSPPSGSKACEYRVVVRYMHL